MATKLELSEGRISGARYYTVQPMMTWTSTRRDWIDMEQWCTDTFGPTHKEGVWLPAKRWYANDRKFWFRKEADRTWFVLRWG